MKLAEHANSLQTNVQGETSSFAIGNVSIILDILRKRMYGKPKQTLVQEYLCNARDAMREVGKGNEFEVVAIGEKLREEVVYGYNPQAEGRAINQAKEWNEVFEADETANPNSCENCGEEDAAFYNFCPACGERQE